MKFDKSIGWLKSASISKEISMKFKYTAEQISEDPEIKQYAEAIKILEEANE